MKSRMQSSQNESWLSCLGSRVTSVNCKMQKSRCFFSFSADNFCRYLFSFEKFTERAAELFRNFGHSSKGLWESFQMFPELSVSSVYRKLSHKCKCNRICILLMILCLMFLPQLTDAFLWTVFDLITYQNRLHVSFHIVLCSDK